jgi:hypothetical protein
LESPESAQARTPGFGARPWVSRRESIVADMLDRATLAILSAEAWFGHGAFAETVCGERRKLSAFFAESPSIWARVAGVSCCKSLVLDVSDQRH